MAQDEVTRRFDAACRNGWAFDPRTGDTFAADSEHLRPYDPRKGRATQVQILQRSGFREDWWVIRYAHAHVWTTLGVWALAHAEAATEALAEADAERAEWFAPGSAKDAKRPEWVAA